jgi:hypothetical protein
MWKPKNKPLFVLMLTGFLLRAVPMLVWLGWPCVRDECTYLRLAERMANGHGMTSSVGWLWAPGYPFLISIFEKTTGWGSNIKVLQLFVATFIIYFMYKLGKRFGKTERSGLIAAGLYALSPTQIFFAMSLWSECLYGGLLLLAIGLFDRLRASGSTSLLNTDPSEENLAALENVQPKEAKEKASIIAVKLGLIVGVCVLFRGVATYMLPIFLVALVWKRLRDMSAWKQGVFLLIGTTLMVAPYSIYISKKYDHRIISDRTMGQMMWLGNNDFNPVTFDWGNGQLSRYEFKTHTKIGRKACGSKSDAMGREDCQTENGITWIKSNSEEFVRRMPLRAAQLLNPHSFLTRHLRWGYWRGLPQPFDEFLILWNVLWSFIVIWGGTIGLCAKGRGGRGLLISGILLYHVAAISILAGLTRYRVPLEPLLMLYSALLLSNPRKVFRNLRDSPWRLFALGVSAAFLVPLCLYFLPTGWSWWQYW